MMVALRKNLLILSMLGIGVSTAWTFVLDEKARASLCGAGAAIKRLVDHAVRSYVGTPDDQADEDATKANQAWVREQWRNVGY